MPEDPHVTITFGDLEFSGKASRLISLFYGAGCFIAHTISRQIAHNDLRPSTINDGFITIRYHERGNS